MIHLYKYGRVKTLARPLGALLAAALPREERFDAVTPVPLHWRRQWQRASTNRSCWRGPSRGAAAFP